MGLYLGSNSIHLSGWKQQNKDLFKKIINRTISTESLPNNLATIGDGTFRECTNLAWTSLPEGITSIGSSAFYDCSSLALTSLPSTLTSIGSSAFYGCSNLALTSLPSTLTSIWSYAFYNCSNLALTSLPEGITTIGNYAFYKCSKITTIIANGNITSLGNYSFQRCSNLVRALFPNMSISSLGTVFGSTASSSACQKLQEVDLGYTKSIAANAFANCTALQTIHLRKTDSIVTLANTSAFTNVKGPVTIKVPSSLVSSYQTATNWSTLYNNGTVTFEALT